MTRSVVVALPPSISDLAVLVPGEIGAECDDAVRAIAALDATRGTHLRPLATLLLRAESVASSKIEHEEATIEDYARALHGSRANGSATAMVAAGGAMDLLLHGPIGEESITAAHGLLLGAEPHEAPYAGRWRTMQNWIGGSDHAPRGALYVPPPPDRVAPLMADLVGFARRRDLPVIVQAALAHAQFESIHPFTDGNGRIGRALAAAVVRHRGLAQHVVVPTASALVTQRERYFAALDAYRAGDAGPVVSAFARSARIAAEEARASADLVAGLPVRWREQVGVPRAGSAPSLLVESLATHPIFTTDDVERRLGLPAPTAHRAVERLVAAGVVRPLTQRKRNQVWGAGALLDELDDLGVRIGVRARAEPWASGPAG
ncbi:Fic family protein [Nocardioides sp. WV_118_6]|uniref:Fic family protein n=1 Tax=Nocardioides simplex TaxID=2045 RepID=UPI0021502ED4|nr:Fic family protein [Pimelobacter simplex]UUW87944.1 Fic family protein [Pimelobacter simplex]UUW97449.1 Fic family protein [Pimelobacter simplex]